MIVVNRNQSAIFGNVDGVKFKNVIFKKENYDSLSSIAKAANGATNQKDYKGFVKQFNEMVAVFNGSQPQVKKEVKVGTTGLSIVSLDTEEGKKPFLFNGRGYSKFYVPKEIHERIQESESKEIDAKPLYKFFIRLLRNPVLTQDKANRISSYISKPWVDQDLVKELMDSGLLREDAAKQASGLQVGITEEGLLVTYKVSTLVGESNRPYVETEDEEESWENEEEFEDEDNEDEEICDDEVEGKTEAELEAEFKYTPTRNNKGHFYKRGGDEYTAEYNRQLATFKAANSNKKVVVEKTVSKKVDSKKVTEKVLVPATEKFAEDYVFLPAYQGRSGDAFYSGDELGHFIRVGRRHYLPNWNQVNTNDHTSAVPGLHVGGLDYIKGYENKNTVVHNIFVDPQFIGAVVQVENGDGAMRVKEYFVHSSFIGPNRGLYHSSTYAAQTDAEWDAQFQAASRTVEEAEAEIAKIRTKAAEAQALLDNSFVA